MTRFKGNVDVYWNGGIPRWQKLGIFLENQGFCQITATLEVVPLIHILRKEWFQEKSRQFLED